MSISAVVPVLGGIPIYFPSGVSVNQSYQDIDGSTLHRMLDGAAIKQSHWSKIGTSLNGEGFLPSGIDALDFGQPLVLKCAVARAIQSVTNVINLPPNRRSDVPVIVRAIKDTDYQQLTPSVVVGDVVTANVVTGAKAYIAYYWPEITVFANPIQEDVDRNGSNWSWSIECEEV